MKIRGKDKGGWGKEADLEGVWGREERKTGGGVKGGY